MRRMAIILKGCLLALLMAAPAYAKGEEKAHLDVYRLSDAHARIVIVTLFPATFQAEIENGDLTVIFDRPLEVDETAPVRIAPTVFLIAKTYEHRTALRYATLHNAEIYAAQSGNAFVIDVYSADIPAWRRQRPTERDFMRYRLEAAFLNWAPGLKPPPPAPPHLAALTIDDPKESGRARVNIDASVRPVTAFERFRAWTRTESFSAVEQQLLAAITASGGRLGAVQDLIYFYMAHGLYPEALALMSDDAEQRTHGLALMEIVAQFRLGRWRDVVELTSREAIRNLPDAIAWRAMALTRLGAYQQAASAFFDTGPNTVPFEQNAADYYLAKAETALRLENLTYARDAFEKLRRRSLTDIQKDERRFLEAKLIAREGQREVARAMMRNIADSNRAPFAQLAKLALIEDDALIGAVKPASALRQLDALQYEWSGGAFEREALYLRAILSDQTRNPYEAFAARRRLTRLHPEADVSRSAQSIMTAQLSTLIDDAALSPFMAAQVFYENIDMAPPGREGDMLIRHVADELARLDLMSEAIELLRHQVYNRLRGEARSRTGARLAALYLTNGAARDALAVLDATRRTRLPISLTDYRRQLEARALVMMDDHLGALSLLENDESAASQMIRGEAYWAMTNWAAAANAFAAALKETNETALDREYRNVLALKVAAAYALADQADSLEAAAIARLQQGSDDKTQRLLLNFVNGAFEESPGEFFKAYKEYFADNLSG